MQTTKTWLMAAMLVAAIASGAEARGPKAKIDLTPATTGLRGKAAVSLKSATDGTFEVKVQKLAGNTDYDLLVGGIKVVTLHTSKGGSASVKFSTKPRGHALLLGFDPRGEAIEIRDASGTDVLAGTMPAVGEEDGDLTCCIPDDSGPECEDRTQAECDAAGGTVVTAGSCLPDPCGTATPPPGMTTVCCVPDDSGPQCEDRSQADCAAAGGSLVQATSCSPNPCAAAPQSPDDEVQCCVPAYYFFQCEDRSVAACAAEGGINKGPGTCSPDPCIEMPPPSHGLCCLPNAAGDEIECEDRTPDDCTAAGGVNKGSGVCAVDTCGAAPAPDIACCEEHSHALECRARTEAECAAVGGTNVGDTCTPTSCDGL